MRYLLIVCIVLAATASFSYAEDRTIGKQAWIEYMQGALPKAFCRPQQYFRQCFRVSEEECLNVATTVTISCLNRTAPEIPETLVQPQDGSHWGGKVGECAGNAYEQALLDKRINSDRCNDVKNWI